MAPSKKTTTKTAKKDTVKTSKKNTAKTTPSKKVTTKKKTEIKNKTEMKNKTNTKNIQPEERPEGLYLGSSNNQKFYYPQENLKKHFIALGASGSGKTVLSKVVLEEAALAGIPSIVVDVQGDLSALALFGEEESIVENGLDPEVYEHFKKNVNATIYTPISSRGIPLCINPLQLDETNLPEEEIIPILHSIANSFSKLLGYNTSNDKGKFAEAILYSVLKYSFETRDPIENFESLISMIKKPTKKLEDIMSAFIGEEKELDTLIRKIKFLNVGEKKLLFQFGVPVDIEMLLGKKGPGKKKGKTQMSIIYMNTLPDQEEKEFFLAALTTKLYQWMLDHPSKKLQALYMIDEIAPFIPAGAKKPMPKDILKLLFKQARKYGISCVIATQNPGDIDYKAFAQFGTWAIGRLSLKQDIKKVDQAISSIASGEDVKSKLPNLQPGEFVLFAPDISKKLINLKSRWLYTKHQTLDEDEVKEIMKDSQEEFKKYFIKNKQKEENVEEEFEDDTLEESFENDEIEDEDSDVEMENNENEDEFENEEIETYEKQITKNKKSKNKNYEFNCVESITKQDIDEIAQKEKKKNLFGAGEQIVEIKKHHHPYIQARIRTMKKNFFGKKKTEEHIICFDGVNGEIVSVKQKQHKWISETRKLIECSENQLVLAKQVMKEKNPLSITEIANKTGLDERTASKNLKVLTEKAIVTFHKEGKYKYFSSLVPFKTTIQKLSSKELETEVKELDKTQRIDQPEISTEEINKFVRTWFEKSQVIQTKLIQVPFYKIIYNKKGKTRNIEINGVTKEVLE